METTGDAILLGLLVGNYYLSHHRDGASHLDNSFLDWYEV
jgi:hypothetical protein